MERVLTAFRALHIDGSRIGLEQEEDRAYFCTPLGADIIGWDNGIYYCFLDGFGKMVFCVNPETCCDYYVYPIARDFSDFLRLILATGNTNSLQQMIWWNEAQYDAFMALPYEQEYRNDPELVRLLDTIARELDLTPMAAPYQYVKELQREFSYESIQFSNEYYDTLGLVRPDGTECPDNGFEFTPVEIRFER